MLDKNSSKIYVKVKKDERFIKCPFCHALLDLDDVSVPCAHLDHEDYITPRGDEGYDVWFVVPTEDWNLQITPTSLAIKNKATK